MLSQSVESPGRGRAETRRGKSASSLGTNEAVEERAMDRDRKGVRKRKRLTDGS